MKGRMMGEAGAVPFDNVYELEVAETANRLVDTWGQLPSDYIVSDAEHAAWQEEIQFAVAVAESIVRGKRVSTVLRRIAADAIAPESAERRRALERLVERDSMTGLGNDEALAKAQPSADQDPEVCFIVMDGVDFKSYNDALGWSAGDALIIAFAHAVREAAAEYGLEERVFRRGNRSDEIVVLATWDTADLITARARSIMSRRFAGMEPLLDRHGDPHAAADFVGYDFHEGIGKSFAEAVAALMQGKERSKG